MFALLVLTAMVEFSKQETKEKSERINKAKEIIKELLDFNFLPDIETKAKIKTGEEF